MEWLNWLAECSAVTRLFALWPLEKTICLQAHSADSVRSQKFVAAVDEMRRFSQMLLAVISILLPASLRRVRASGQDNEPKRTTAPETLQRRAKITLEQARATALKRAPGTVEEGEPEGEHGKLVYSFDTSNARGTITKVG